MMQYEYLHNDEKIQYFGRTLEDSDSQVTYCNWTCSGLQFEFIGRKVEMEWIVQLIEERDQILYPWIAVFLDREEIPHKIIELRDTETWYTLYESEKVEKHIIKIMKRTEAQHSKTAVKKVRVEGEDYLGHVPLNGRYKIEFIGDSITCGYGNETNNPEDGFQTHQENGLLAYAALTAKNLRADFQCVSVSGIGVYSSYTGTDQINNSLLMPMVYDYTDYFVEKDKKVKDYTKWHTEKFMPDGIVIYLGTNDHSYIKHDKEGRKEGFKKAYIDFLKQVRRNNGLAPWILCVVGVMTPGIYDLIAEAVNDYKEETGDLSIDTLIFDAERMEDGVGGSSHPTVKTHERMAAKLTNKIKDIQGTLSKNQ